MKIHIPKQYLREFISKLKGNIRNIRPNKKLNIAKLFFFPKSFQNRLLLLFTLLITLAIGVLGTTTYLMAKQAIGGLIEDKLVVSAKNVAETVEFYTSTVESEGFNSKVAYLLNKERASFNAKDLKPVLMFVDSEANPTLKVTGVGNTLPKKTLKEVFAKGQGVKSIEINGAKYSAVSQFIPGKNWYYIVALQEHDYLVKVYQLRNLAILIGLVAIAVTFFICLVSARRLAKPLEDIMVACGKASSGDLTVRVNADKMNFEFAVLGKSFNTMLESLSLFLAQNQKTFNQVHKFNKKISSVAKNQVETVEETNSTVRQMAVSVNTIAPQIDSTKTASERMLQAASRGDWALQEIARVIDKNAQVVEEQVIAFQQLGSNISKIGNFMQLIQQVSSQTHLLSLNASIEAARAGEHGRGFSVVAQEVKKLAESSSTAANEVAQLVENIYRQSSLVTNQMEISKNIATQGVEAIQRVEDSLQEISLATQETDGYIELITESVHHVSTCSEQVVAMIQVLASEEQNQQDYEEDLDQARDASAREIAALAHKMDEVTDNLKTGLAVFKFAG